MGDVEKGGIIVGGEPACSAAPLPKCGASWYLPRFLLRGGSLTLINIASFMVSLSTMEKTVQLDGITCGVGMVINRGGSS